MVQSLAFDLRPVTGLHQRVVGGKGPIQLNIYGSEPGEPAVLTWTLE